MFSRRRRRSTTHHRAMRSRGGFALMMAMGALVIIAVLVAGSSYIQLQESRLGQNSLVQSRAFAAAEYGLNKIQADWDRTPNLQMENGASFDTTYTLEGQGTCQVRYTRLNNETFWIIATGEAAANSALGKSRTAVKRMGAILRLRIPSIKAEGAITTNGDVTVKGAGQVRGENTTPPGWTGCPSSPNKSALTVGTSASVSIQKDQNVTGSPQVTKTAVADDPNTYVKFGDETWDALVAQAVPPAGKTITDMADGTPSTNPDGSCNKAATANYGEPWRTAQNAGAVTACNNYFPIVYVSNGDATTTFGSHGGRGQGILLINGHFRFNAGFEWHGLIITRGNVVKANGHAKIYGSIMAAAADPGNDDQDFTGTVDIYYSACSVERAMRGSAQVLQAKERAWAEIY